MLAVPVAALRHVIATQPALSDVILAAFIARRAAADDGRGERRSASSARGSRPSRAASASSSCAAGIPHEWLDPDRDADGRASCCASSASSPSELPVVIATGHGAATTDAGRARAVPRPHARQPSRPLLRPRRRRRRPGRTGRRGLRRVRGAHDAGRRGGAPSAGRPGTARASRTTSASRRASRAATSPSARIVQAEKFGARAHEPVRGDRPARGGRPPRRRRSPTAPRSSRAP